MDAPTPIHPTPQTLQAYGLGMLDDASAEAVSKHLENCLECRRQVAELAPDSFLGRLRDAQERPEPPAAGRATPGGTQTDLGRTAEAPAAASEPFAASPGATNAPTIGLQPHTSSPQPDTTVADDATVDCPSVPCMSSTDHAGTTSAALNSPNGPSLQPGAYVGYFGDYELQRVLGEGGMGIVYRARQLSLNRPVALKMIRAARFASADDLRRFQNEAEAVARLDHPNIVPVFEVGQFEDQHYFSMKLIAGESLDKRLKDYLVDPRRAARLLAVTTGAIHHAHQRGILHRDLKPANILVDSEGQPHVTDFGLAKRVERDSELTQTGAILGTPAYMAPEQTSAKKGAVTTATDVYGLGAILYAMLTGRGPFGGTTLLDTLDQVRKRAPELPRILNPRVPRDLEVICLKCLEKDSSRRYSSAQALADDPHRYLAGEPITARAVGRVERARLWVRRHPTAAVLAGTSLVALIAMIAAGFFIAYNGDLKRANLVIEESRGKLQTAYASEAIARRQAEAAGKAASEQRALAVNALDEARNALDLANYFLDALQITLSQSQGLLPLSFPADDGPALREAISKNQAIAERLAYIIDEVRAEMMRGAGARARETSRRWQGYYDLVLGRLLAMKIRYYEYNWACARMKRDTQKFQRPDSYSWKLVPDEPMITHGTKLAAAVVEAKTLLKRVVDEHPGTPWALLAERELNQPFGFKWVETNIKPVARETQAAAKAKKRQWALLDLAADLARQGQWETAREALGQAGDPISGTAEASGLLQKRGDLFALLGLWDRAAADYSEEFRLQPEDPSTRHHQILALRAAGDRDASRKASSELLDRFRKTSDSDAANNVAWFCALSPGAVADQEATVRLAEFALKYFPADQKHLALNTLGAALYRAGRFEDAIRRLEERIRLRNGTVEPVDWAFLAMAHHRLGHRDEARRWLDHFKNYQPSAYHDQFWDELEIRLLRSEAEAVILYDPIFPADPFAH